MPDETEQTDSDRLYAEGVPEQPPVESPQEDDDLGQIVESLEDEVELPTALAEEPEAELIAHTEAELAAEATAEAYAEQAAEEPEEATEPAAEEAADETEPTADVTSDAADEASEDAAEQPEVAAADQSDPVEADAPEQEPASDAEAFASPEVELEPKRRSPVPRWPFWTLAGVWFALCAGAAYVLTRDPAMPSLRQDAYTFVVAAGLALTVLGPIAAVVVWLFARSSADEGSRSGMFATSLMRAALVTFFGVIAWTGVLVVVDALRLGLIRF